MKFRKYQHIERFGTTEVQDIELGVCYIFPKIDGTNASVWLSDDGELCAGSRNRELTLNSDNAGFFAFALQQENIIKFLKDNPNLRLYGEWLVPHSLRTYRDDAWRTFNIFDVVEELGNDEFRYLPYNEYKELLEKYELNYIPTLAIIRNTNYEQLVGKLPMNDYLIQDGKGAGEGVVIKRYDFVNRYGRTTWAKIVSSEFKAKHSKVMCGGQVSEGKKMVEESIVEKYVTKSLCEKVYAKIVNDNDGWRSKYIPMLLNMVYYDLIREECWNFVKEFKNPKIDFRLLSVMCSNKVKHHLSNIF